jgi:uncharacterized protein (DUF302 family)
METMNKLDAHVVVASAKPYEQVISEIESIVMTGKIDLAEVEQIVLASNSWEEFQATIEEKVGNLNLMTFTEIDHGSLMSLAVEGTKAKLYVIGNPLIARQMLEENLEVGLYVPLRFLIYENSLGKTQITYDKPSSLLFKFQNKKILTIAKMLDHKLEELTHCLAN